LTANRRIEALIGQFRTHINVELQQRSCEYVSIFGRSDSSSLRGALLERMPAAEGGAFADAEGSEQAAEVVTAQSIISSLSATATNSAHDPLDIMKQLFGDLPSDAGAARTGTRRVSQKLSQRRFLTERGGGLTPDFGILGVQK
jgi:hypothetical protein